MAWDFVVSSRQTPVQGGGLTGASVCVAAFKRPTTHSLFKAFAEPKPIERPVLNVIKPRGVGMLLEHGLPRRRQIKRQATSQMDSADNGVHLRSVAQPERGEQRACGSDPAFVIKHVRIAELNEDDDL